LAKKTAKRWVVAWGEVREVTWAARKEGAWGATKVGVKGLSWAQSRVKVRAANSVDPREQQMVAPLGEEKA